LNLYDKGKSRPVRHPSKSIEKSSVTLHLPLTVLCDCPLARRAVAEAHIRDCGRRRSKSVSPFLLVSLFVAIRELDVVDSERVPVLRLLFNLRLETAVRGLFSVPRKCLPPEIGEAGRPQYRPLRLRFRIGIGEACHPGSNSLDGACLDCAWER
jgi:hypothetical protein